MHESEIEAVELIGPEIDLDSIHFLDEEYKSLKQNFLENQENYPDIKVIDKYIYIRTAYARGDEQTDENCWKLWIPKALSKTILKRSHDSAVASHGGISKTLSLIRQYFYWPKLVTDVKEYIAQCEVCNTSKPTNKILTPKMGNMATSCRPFQRLYVEILGPYPRSKKGFIGLLIVLDHFSK